MIERPANRSARGFTLLETLVTLVVVALVAGLISQGLFQLARIERTLATAQTSGPQLERLHEQWLVDALRSAVVTGDKTREGFHGEPLRLRGLSTSLPTRMPQGITEFSMTLVANQLDTALWLEFKEIGVEPVRVRLASWPLQELRWVYEDDAGRTYAQWPPADDFVRPALPRLIRLEQGQLGRLLLIASPQNSYLRAPAVKDEP